MKKEEAFEAMKNGAKIAHVTWKDGEFIREVDGYICDERGDVLKECESIPLDGWYIVEHAKQPEGTAFLLREIILHLEDPKRVWNYSGHEAEPAIAKGIRLLHGEIEMLKRENAELKQAFRYDWSGEEAVRKIFKGVEEYLGEVHKTEIQKLKAEIERLRIAST